MERFPIDFPMISGFESTTAWDAQKNSARLVIGGLLFLRSRGGGGGIPGFGRSVEVPWEKPWESDLVGGLVAIFFIFPYLGNFIIPIDFHLFQRGSNHQPVMVKPTENP